MSQDYVQTKARFPAEEYEPTEADWVFTAGVVTGEGYISEVCIKQKNGSRKHFLGIHVRMQDEGAIRQIARTWGLGCRTWEEERLSSAVWHVGTTGRKAEAIIRRIYPYLAHTRKGEQVRESFAFLELQL